MKFRRKPVTVEAVRYTDGNLREVLDFTGKHPRWDKWFPSFEAYEHHVLANLKVFKILTPEGTMEALPGDWIIKGVRGEFYPCKPDIFAATYEPVKQAMTDTSTEALRKLQGEITPGPWKAVATGGADELNEVFACDHAGHEMISVADVEGANARAIALLPDLLSEVLRLREQNEALAAALRGAKAALADIGDAEREPGDDLEWCEQRAAEALPAVRAALATLDRIKP